jgi:hypothetical protein
MRTQRTVRTMGLLAPLPAAARTTGSTAQECPASLEAILLERGYAQVELSENTAKQVEARLEGEPMTWIVDTLT